MQAWSNALFLVTGLSGLFAFGVIQSAYSQQALALFYVFAALMVVMLAFKFLFRGGGGHGHGHSAHGGGDHAVVMSGRMVGTTMLAAALFAVVYFWTDNQLTAEKIGREIDRGVAGAWQQGQATFTGLINRDRPEQQG